MQISQKPYATGLQSKLNQLQFSHKPLITKLVSLAMKFLGNETLGK